MAKLPLEALADSVDLDFEEVEEHWNTYKLSDGTTIKVRLVEFDGNPYSLVSDEVSVPAAANGWAEIPFVGLAPELQDFEVTITDPVDLDIHYPRETFTSLARDALLEDGETDVVRFRVGEPHWGQTLDVDIAVAFLLAGQPATETHALTITIE